MSKKVGCFCNKRHKKWIRLFFVCLRVCSSMFRKLVSFLLSPSVIVDHKYPQEPYRGEIMPSLSFILDIPVYNKSHFLRLFYSSFAHRIHFLRVFFHFFDVFVLLFLLLSARYARIFQNCRQKYVRIYSICLQTSETWKLRGINLAVGFVPCLLFNIIHLYRIHVKCITLRVVLATSIKYNDKIFAIKKKKKVQERRKIR